MKYHSRYELFRLWTAEGMASLEPERSSWELHVRGPLLIRRREGNPEVVGLRCAGDPPRPFWYLVSAWRGRLSTRTELEQLGGMPAMPFEFFSMLHDLGTEGLAPADVQPGDVAGWRFVWDWVVSSGSKQGNHLWREYGLGLKAGQLTVARKVRTGTVSVSPVALFEDPTHLRLLGHARGSPSVLWVRDAVYVCVGRALAAGRLLPGFELLRMGTTLGLPEPREERIPLPRMLVPEAEWPTPWEEEGTQQLR